MGAYFNKSWHYFCFIINSLQQYANLIKLLTLHAINLQDENYNK